MAVVTAAVMAVGAAIATTTLATVATAAVAVSALIGTMGLAVTAVGMITKNQDLLKAGKIMGYVGLAGGIAGWGVGAYSMGASEFASHVGSLYSEAWNTGVGSFFQPDPAVLGAQQEALGKGIVAGTSPEYAQNMAPSFVGYSPAEQAAMGQGVVAGTQGAQAAQAAPLAAVGPAAGPAAGADPSAMVQPAAGTQAPSAPLSGTEAPVAPAASTAGTQAPSVVQGGVEGPTMPGTATFSKPGIGESMSNWWAKQPDWVKMQLMMTGAQGAAGLASGYMSGLSAEQRLELDQLIANRNEEQRQLINANNRYAPKIGFQPGGLRGAAGRPA